MNIRQGSVLISFFISLLVHLFLFGAFSLEIFWPKTVSAKRPISVRIVPMAKPPPEEPQSPNPESRNLSDANRKESGAGEPSENPKLRGEEEEALASKQGFGVVDVPVQVVAPPPSPPPAPKVPLETEPAPQARAVEPPPVSEPREEVPAASVVLEPDSPKRMEAPPLPAPDGPKPESVEVKSIKPGPAKRKEELPKPVALSEIEAVREAPAEKTVSAKKFEPEKVKQENIPPPPAPRARAVEPPPKLVASSEIEAVREAPAEKTVSVKKVESEKVKQENIPPPPPKLPEPKEPIEVAALPPSQAAPRPDGSGSEEAFAMIKLPEKRGRPDAPDLNLTDDEAARISKAAREREAEEGEAVSLETRDYRYVSYFAHIKRRIEEVWRWPPEARNFEGKVQMQFVLKEDGSLARVDILRSSGYRILDDVAHAAVTKAAPFHPFPPDFEIKILPIVASFSYEHRRGLLSPK